jgi:hypothetical protein
MTAVILNSYPKKWSNNICSRIAFLKLGTSQLVCFGRETLNYKEPTQSTITLVIKRTFKHAKMHFCYGGGLKKKTRKTQLHVETPQNVTCGYF